MWLVDFPKNLKYRVKLKENLALHSSLKIGGYADLWFEPKNLCELNQAARFAREEKIPFYVVGAGTNVIFPDEGIKGIVVRLSGEFESIRFHLSSSLVGSGVSIQQLLRECLIRELGGCEFLAGIPGTIGGALITNAGTLNGNIGDLVEGVICLDVDKGVVKLTKDEIDFRYRGSSLDNYIILFCTLRLLRRERPDIMHMIYDNLHRRKKTQGDEYPNAGCIFKNPANSSESAGAHIESVGLKGYRVGSAMISKKHANFILNIGMARSNDVVSLMRFVQKRVWEEKGVRLEPEVRFVGSFHEEVLLNGR